MHSGAVTGAPSEREVVERRIERESRVRGLLLGLALGDAIETGARHGAGAWRGSTTTQLACFVSEGIIRASVRGNAKGICHPPSVMWHALARWSVQQHLDLPVDKQWRGGTSGAWPDGWLASVEVLSARRGSAPATVQALTHGHGAPPTTEELRAHPPHSRGHHALTRSIPLAAVLEYQADQWARELASFSHDPTTVPDVVETCMLVLRAALQTREERQWHDAVAVLREDASRPVGAVLDAPLESAPAGTAHRALLAAVAAWRQHDSHEDLGRVMAAAATTPGAGAVAGALVGALHGVERLPATLWSLEHGWVMDTLARDLVVQLDEPRSPDAGAVEDPRWWDRYPGW